MANWNHKQLDRIAAISGRYAADESIPPASRALFAKARSTAKNLESNPQAFGVGGAFLAFQVAASDAGICRRCGQPCALLSCRLLWDSAI